MGVKSKRLNADREINYHNARLVKNEDYTEGSSGTYISADQIVSVTGASGSVTTVSKAQADVSLDISQLWIAKEAIWEYGEVTRWAHLTAVDTSGSTIGNPVYLSDTAGGWSLTPGTVPAVVGKVLVVSATIGEISMDLGTVQPSGTIQSGGVAVVADPGTGTDIPVDKSASIAITTAAAETNTLAIPSFQGQTLTLFVVTYAVGNRVITASAAINAANNTIMTFGVVSDFIKLEGITLGGALVWQVIANDGVALS